MMMSAALPYRNLTTLPGGRVLGRWPHEWWMFAGPRLRLPLCQPVVQSDPLCWLLQRQGLASRSALPVHALASCWASGIYVSTPRSPLLATAMRCGWPDRTDDRAASSMHAECESE